MATTSNTKTSAIWIRLAVVTVTAIAFALAENEIVRAQPGSVQSLGFPQPTSGFGGPVMPAVYAAAGGAGAAQYATFSPHGIPISASPAAMQAQWLAASHGAVAMGGGHVPPGR